MLYTSESTDKPSKVTIESLPDGTKRVILADNIKKEQRTEAAPESTETISYKYDAVDFILPEDRADETVETIEEDFDAWISYGSTPQTEPTLEERVAALEELAMS